MRARVPIYGMGDAARGWWLKISGSLIDCGWTQSELEPALFYLWDEEKQLVGMAVTHFDDVLYCGEGELYATSVRKLEPKPRISGTAESTSSSWATGPCECRRRRSRRRSRGST